MAFLLLYWTGMRIGELLALTYDDINLEEKTISITKSYQRLKGKDVITQPKTPKSIRIITMPYSSYKDEANLYTSSESADAVLLQEGTNPVLSLHSTHEAVRTPVP